MICTQCGMHTQPNEYHPYAACLMFLACHDGRVVRANLEAVVAYNDKACRDRLAQAEGMLREVYENEPKTPDLFNRIDAFLSGASDE